jgi:glycosyltransferase involved in cell wall biosynthesis
MVEAVAERLARDGNEVTVLTSAGGYGEKGGVVKSEEKVIGEEFLVNGANRQAADVTGVRVLRIRTFSFGRGSFFGKVLDYVSFYFCVAWRLFWLSPKPDVVVALTTPPFLSVLVRLVTRLRGIGSHSHWVMDLYPDVMVAHGMLKGRFGKVLGRFLGGMTRWGFGGKRSRAVVTLGPDMKEAVDAYLPKGMRSEWVPLWATVGIGELDNLKLGIGAEDLGSEGEPRKSTKGRESLGLRIRGTAEFAEKRRSAGDLGDEGDEGEPRINTNGHETGEMAGDVGTEGEPRKSAKGHEIRTGDIGYEGEPRNYAEGRGNAGDLEYEGEPRKGDVRETSEAKGRESLGQRIRGTAEFAEKRRRAGNLENGGEPRINTNGHEAGEMAEAVGYEGEPRKDTKEREIGKLAEDVGTEGEPRKSAKERGIRELAGSEAGDDGAQGEPHAKQVSDGTQSGSVRQNDAEKRRSAGDLGDEGEPRINTNGHEAEERESDDWGLGIRELGHEGEPPKDAEGRGNGEVAEDVGVEGEPRKNTKGHEIRTGDIGYEGEPRNYAEGRGNEDVVGVGGGRSAAVATWRVRRRWGDDEVVFLYSGNMGLGHRFGEFLKVGENAEGRLQNAEGQRLAIRMVFSGGGKRRREIEAVASRERSMGTEDGRKKAQEAQKGDDDGVDEFFDDHKVVEQGSQNGGEVDVSNPNSPISNNQSPSLKSPISNTQISNIIQSSIPMELLDYVPSEDLATHLLSGDVHLASLEPSWDGTMVPSKLQGSFSIGRPVIFVGSETCSIGRWILESGGGWVVAPNDLDGLRGAMREACDAGERKRRGENALLFAREHFDRERNAARVGALLTRGVTMD